MFQIGKNLSQQVASCYLMMPEGEEQTFSSLMGVSVDAWCHRMVHCLKKPALTTFGSGFSEYVNILKFITIFRAPQSLVFWSSSVKLSKTSPGVC